MCRASRLPLHSSWPFAPCRNAPKVGQLRGIWLCANCCDWAAVDAIRSPRAAKLCARASRSTEVFASEPSLPPASPAFVGTTRGRDSFAAIAPSFFSPANECCVLARVKREPDCHSPMRSEPFAKSVSPCSTNERHDDSAISFAVSKRNWKRNAPCSEQNFPASRSCSFCRPSALADRGPSSVPSEI